jgi:DNA-binding Lrp family transcriptional regulator
MRDGTTTRTEYVADVCEQFARSEGCRHEVALARAGGDGVGDGVLVSCARRSADLAQPKSLSPERSYGSGMSDADIDDVDRAILHALQTDARHTSSGDIADRSGASGSTVRKRIQRLESLDVIKGYSADVDYGRAGFPLRMLLFCTAPIPDRGDLVPDILDVPGVVSVQELVTGEENLLVTAVGRTDADVTTVARELLSMGLSISDEVLVRSHESTAFDGFRAPDE